MRIIASPGIRANHKNPYTRLLYQPMLELGVEVLEATPARVFFGKNISVWHLHWPDGALNYPSTPKVTFKLFKIFCQLYWAKVRGIRIVWTAHNLRAHEQLHPRLEAWFWRRFISCVDGVISLSETGRRLSFKTFPCLKNKPSAVIAHGHYKGVYPDTVSRADARTALGLAKDAKVALFLGHIRPYKNVKHLLEVFSELPEADYQLLIAGTPNTRKLKEELLAAQQPDDRVIMHLQSVPVERMQYYLRAADIMVLPYESVLNSGVALLALSFACRVLAPSEGALIDLEHGVGKRWLTLYAGRLTGVTLNLALQESTQLHAALPDLKPYNWDELAEETLVFFNNVLTQNK